MSEPNSNIIDRAWMAFTSVGFVFVLAVVSTAFSAHEVSEATKSTLHAHSMLETCQQLSASLRNISVAQQEVNTTGDTRALSTIQFDVEHVHSSVEKLRALSADNKALQVAVEKLSELTEKRLVRSTELIKLGKRTVNQLEDASSSNSNSNSSYSKLLADYRAQIAVVDREEEQLLDTRAKQLQQTQTLSLALILVLCILGLFLLVWIARALQTYVTLETRSKAETAKVAALLDFNEDPIFVQDADRKIQYWNKGAEHTYGFSKDEVMGKIPARILSTKFPVPYEEIQNALLTDKRWEGQLTQTAKDGRVITVSSRWVKQDDGTVLEANRDISQLAASEQQLQILAEKLTRSNQDLQQFAYVASHDLQEPLRAVIGFMSLLDKRLGDRLAETERSWLNHAVDGAERMRSLITGLLAFSRVEGQGQKLETDVNLNEVMASAVSNLTQMISETGAEIDYAPLPVVIGDKVQLIQLMQNLIGNGIKYRDSERAPEIKVSVEETSECFIVSVEDNGIGFDLKDAERIFVIFQRLHTRDKYSGTGIGLALCKRIVERHRGKIWCDSTPGHGSTFAFSLPKIAAANPLLRHSGSHTPV